MNDAPSAGAPCATERSPQGRLRQLAASRRAWFALLFVFAVGHYACYFRHGLNFRDEGGTVALVAQRMLAGERPFTDVALGGYNVLWFWPVVGLFKVVGVDYVALRAFCFVLATITALLVFWMVDRASRRPWLAFLVATMAVLVPGMTFKNYMPLLAVANSAGLLGFTLAPAGTRARWWRLIVGGVVLGATWLIRVDLGIFFTALWLGGSILGALHRATARARVVSLLAAPLALTGIVVACHLPFYADAKKRDYDASFTAQYSLWPKMMLGELRRLVPAQRPALPPAKVAPVEVVAAKAPVAKAAAGRDILRRKGWRDVFAAPTADQRLLAVLLYLPLFSLVPLALAALWQWLRALRSTAPDAAPRALAALLVIGGGLTVFPQYFFFRPDSPHLSEFSPSFWAAVAAAPFLLGLRGWTARLCAALLLGHAAIFLWRMWPDRWAGTIWVRKDRRTRFEAENGVRVFLTKREALNLAALRDTIRAHAQPGDYLVAYPYHPALNLLSNLPTYERDVYVDNATRGARWSQEAIERIEKYQPAVIVLSEWAVNGHDESRFSAWAGAAKAWIQEHYEAQGTFPVSSDRFEVYTRPAKP